MQPRGFPNRRCYVELSGHDFAKPNNLEENEKLLVSSMLRVRIRDAIDHSLQMMRFCEDLAAAPKCVVQIQEARFDVESGFFLISRSEFAISFRQL